MDMLNDVMLHARKRIENCWIDPEHSKKDTFEIKNGVLDASFLVTGQYFIITGSYFNDGVYAYTDDLTLNDEKSEFEILSIKPPKAFIDLVKDIEEWQTTYGNATDKPFASESFDGYSYSRETNSEGLGISWKDVFKTRLNAWRML